MRVWKSLKPGICLGHGTLLTNIYFWMEIKHFKVHSLHYPEIFYIIQKVKGDTARRVIQITIDNPKGHQRNLFGDSYCVRLTFSLLEIKEGLRKSGVDAWAVCITQSSGQQLFPNHYRRMSVFPQPGRSCILCFICSGTSIRKEWS